MEITLTSENFDSVIANAKVPVLVDFWATWCGPCRMLAPIVEEVANEKADSLTVGKVNVDDCPDLAHRFGIVSIPTLILFRDGNESKKSVGYMQKNELVAFIGQ